MSKPRSLYRGALLFSGLVCSWLIGIAYAGTTPQLTAHEIMQKVEDFDDGDNSINDIEFVLTDHQGNQQGRKLRRFGKNFGADGRDEYAYTYFYSPAALEGTRVLTYDYHDDQKDDETWIFIPEVGKIKRLTSKDKTSKLMGTDINYGDLTQRNLDNYEFKLLGEERVRNWDTYMIEFTPTTEEEVKRFGYLKGHVWVDKVSFRAVRSIFWKDEGNQIKYFEIYKMENIDGIWTALDMSFTVKRGDVVAHRTDMHVSNVHYNQNLPSSLFVPEYLDTPLPDPLRPEGPDPQASTKKPSVLGALRVKAMMSPAGLFGIPKGIFGLVVMLIVLSIALALIAIVRRRRRALSA
jgi:outer membrane lipoprotein-sorting protein